MCFALIYIFYNGYFIIFDHFDFCCKIKLRLRNAVFEMQPSFHVWGSHIRRPAFVCSKIIFVEFIHVNTKQKSISFYSYKLKQSLRS